MSTIAFQQVDVFTAVPFSGNPVAVVLDAGSLSSAQMQAIARWTNLSETTFVLPATDARADYALRIFTPVGELPFAGHPTIGTAHALLQSGRIEARDGRLVQDCGAGLIALSVEDDVHGRWIFFTAPETTLVPLDDAATRSLDGVLGASRVTAATPVLVDIGPRWIVRELADAQAVLDLQPDFHAMRLHDRQAGNSGVVVFGFRDGPTGGIETRAFAPAHGVDEDPVCGSGNAAVAALLRARQPDVPCTTLHVRQGRAIGRDGYLRLRIGPDGVQVGGQAVSCIEGTLTV